MSKWCFVVRCVDEVTNREGGSMIDMNSFWIGLIAGAGLVLVGMALMWLMMGRPR